MNATKYCKQPSKVLYVYLSLGIFFLLLGAGIVIYNMVEKSFNDYTIIALLIIFAVGLVLLGITVKIKYGKLEVTIISNN